MKRTIITRYARVYRSPVTLDAVPSYTVEKPKRKRGPNPALHDFFYKLLGIAAGLLVLIPMLYYVITT